MRVKTDARKPDQSDSRMPRLTKRTDGSRVRLRRTVYPLRRTACPCGSTLRSASPIRRLACSTAVGRIRGDDARERSLASEQPSVAACACVSDGFLLRRHRAHQSVCTRRSRMGDLISSVAAAGSGSRRVSARFDADWKLNARVLMSPPTTTRWLVAPAAGGGVSNRLDGRALEPRPGAYR
jgi:hypothetical protein